jgi:hypothetical protein
MYDDVLIDLGAISEETNGLPIGEAETQGAFYQG